MNGFKEKIILDVFEFLETKELKYANFAKENLTELAKYYHIKITKQAPINLKEAFKLFVKNGSGYQVTIPKLYNSL